MCVCIELHAFECMYTCMRIFYTQRESTMPVKFDSVTGI